VTTTATGRLSQRYPGNRTPATLPSLLLQPAPASGMRGRPLRAPPMTVALIVPGGDGQPGQSTGRPCLDRVTRQAFWELSVVQVKCPRRDRTAPTILRSGAPWTRGQRSVSDAAPHGRGHWTAPGSTAARDLEGSGTTVEAVIRGWGFRASLCSPDWDLGCCYVVLLGPSPPIPLQNPLHGGAGPRRDPPSCIPLQIPTPIAFGRRGFSALPERLLAVHTCTRAPR
jgi:hypothetical protein